MLLLLAQSAASSPSGASYVKVWDGTKWTSKPLKVWDNGNWLTKGARVWNGTFWTFPEGYIKTTPITRSGSDLKIANTTTRFGGANMYWLGLDDNQGGSPGTFPTNVQITKALVGARQMGVNLVRAHTIGMSAGTSKSFETAPGVFAPENLDAADYAVYQAKRNGIYLQVPLTDNWNYYHGGKWNFVHWAYQQNPSGLTDTPGTIKDDSNERQFFGNSSDQLRIRALFKAYISTWLDHFNPYTGLKYKDDPTIAILETGSEIYAATDEWTQDIASYIKSLAPQKLVADGSAATGLAVANAPGVRSAAIDIVGSHYYVASSDYSQQIGFGATPSQYGTSTSALQQLAADANAANSAGKAFIVGEYPWTRSDVDSWYSAVESNPKISGDMFWAIIANQQDGTPLTHGGAYGGDDYSLHRPYASYYEKTYGPALARHLSTLSGIATTNGSAASTNLIVQESIARASDPTLFSAGGATLSKDTTVFQEGGSSMLLTPSSAGSYPYWYANTAAQWAPVTPGNTYSGVGSVRTSTGSFMFHAILIWYRSDGTVISTSAGAVMSTTVNQWKQLVAKAVAPSGAAYASVQLQADSAMNVSDAFNVDQYGVFDGANVEWSYTTPVPSGSTTYTAYQDPSEAGTYAGTAFVEDPSDAGVYILQGTRVQEDPNDSGTYLIS